MDPVTFLAVAAFTAWLVAAPDRATLTATRGTLAAARSAGRAAAGVVRSEWAATAPARSAAWTARKDRLGMTRKGRATLAGIWVLGAGWRATRAAGRAIRAGIAAAPAGYRDGARRAGDRREQRRTTSHRPASARTGRVLRPATPTGPVTGAAGTGAGGLRVVDADGRPTGSQGADESWDAEFGPDPARVAAADQRRQRLREAGFRGPTDADGYAVDAQDRRLTDTEVADQITADQRRQRLRGAGYPGPIDTDGYAVDAGGRRLTDTELAARVVPDHRGHHNSGQEPVVLRCWAKDCTEPTLVPSVLCAGHEQEAARNWAATHDELPIAQDQDEATASAGSTPTNPAGGPADGTTTTEETTMPSIVSGMLDQLTGAASDFVDFNRSGEWETTADLRTEVDQAEELAEAAQALTEALRKWADALEEAYAAAPFHTRAMAESVAAINESAGDPAALSEALLGMRQALDEADALGEAGEALDAAGNVEAFAAQ